MLALSEVVGLLGKPYAPILPPWGTGLAVGMLRRAGLRIPPEMLSQLRFGRGLDNRKLKATGFGYRYTQPGDGDQAGASTCGSSRSCAAPSESLHATSARWRTSCAGART